MTILELEQGLRNLVASQPSVMQSANGPVVDAIMGLIDSTKNMMYRVQTYPVQDAFRFSMAAEVQRMEASIISLTVQNLQARGINLMLYIPQDAQFAQLAGAYGAYSSNADESIFGSPMAYIPNTTPEPPVAAGYDMAETASTASKHNKKKASSEDAIPQASGYGKTSKKIDLILNKIKSAKSKQKEENAQQNLQEKEDVKQKGKATTDDEEANQPENDEAQASSQAEAQNGASGSKRPGNSAGRDYLVELLKK